MIANTRVSDSPIAERLFDEAHERLVAHPMGCDDCDLDRGVACIRYALLALEEDTAAEAYGMAYAAAGEYLKAVK